MAWQMFNQSEYRHQLNNIPQQPVINQPQPTSTLSFQPYLPNPTAQSTIQTTTGTTQTNQQPPYHSDQFQKLFNSYQAFQSNLRHYPHQVPVHLAYPNITPQYIPPTQSGQERETPYEHFEQDLDPEDSIVQQEVINEISTWPVSVLHFLYIYPWRGEEHQNSPS